jgi:hypothetical protein
MFGVFEAFFLFADPTDEHRARTLVRDAVRYRPDLVDLAERALRSPSLAGRAFSAIHIRRGDFQYKETRVGAADILRHTERLFTPGQTLYIATDETDPAFLDVFRRRYDVITFADLGPDLVAVPFHWKGVVETLVCAAAPGRFVGTRLSTLSARISILRGHLSRTPDRPLTGIDTALYYTQPPLWSAGRDDSRPYREPVGKHEDEFGETALPWWESCWTTPVWGRAHQAIWNA